MKRLAFLLILILVFSGCSPSATVSGDTYNFENDDQYYFDKSMGFNTIAETKDGYYFFGGPKYMYLYYMDKSTMKPVLMCNKPDCLHTEETESEKTMNCNAFFSDANNNLMYYKSSLYMVQLSAGSGLSLNRVSLDATKRHQLYNFKDFLFCMMIHRGYVYYIVNETTFVSDKSSAAKGMVYRNDLNNLSKEPELIYECEGYDTFLHDLKGYGDYVYFSASYFENSNFTNKHNTILRYSVIRKSCEKVADNANRLTFYNDTLLFDGDKQQVYSCNLDGSGLKKLDKVIGYSMCADDKYIYTINYTTSSADIIIYNWNGSEGKRFHISPLYMLCGCDDKYLFIYEMGGNELGEISRLYIVDKNKLADGSATLEKVFEYVPTHQFPGVVTNN